MVTTDELRDRAELRDLVEGYARGADTRDGQVYADVFTEDAVLHTKRGDLRGRHVLDEDRDDDALVARSVEGIVLHVHVLLGDRVHEAPPVVGGEHGPAADLHIAIRVVAVRYAQRDPVVEPEVAEFPAARD